MQNITSERAQKIIVDLHHKDYAAADIAKELGWHVDYLNKFMADHKIRRSNLELPPRQTVSSRGSDPSWPKITHSTEALRADLYGNLRYEDDPRAVRNTVAGRVPCRPETYVARDSAL